ncbi:MAG: [citrate (pro-3S)-lyase] ligase [Desulfuromonas sp.]|nr:MAG: [citrate (pro-3S)-lyase] ligase [Desulfuromonas sp.]
MVVRLISERDQNSARQLVEAQGFRFEENFDVLVGVFDAGELIATAAREGHIFKMICIREDFQGGSLLGELLTELIASCSACRRDNFFVFTKPERRSSFEQLNFRVLVEHPQLCLLEYGNGLQNYLRQQRELVRPGNNGAIVMNANPFTLGHLYLVEQAAAQVDQLYLFVVREDCSTFPFATRIALVREGVAHLANVSVLETSDYAVSRVTFPAYFLKAGADVETLQMEVDLLLFARCLAPAFNITTRFVGTEPYCRVTRHYNETMIRLLAEEGIKTVLLSRREVKGEPISASLVRRLLKKEAFEELDSLVPETTLACLRSHQAAEIHERLRAQGRH